MLRGLDIELTVSSLKHTVMGTNCTRDCFYSHRYVHKLVIRESFPASADRYQTCSSAYGNQAKGGKHIFPRLCRNIYCSRNGSTACKDLQTVVAYCIHIVWLRSHDHHQEVEEFLVFNEMILALKG